MKLGIVSVRIGLDAFLSSEIFHVKWFISLGGNVARRITGTIWKRYEHYSIAQFCTATNFVVLQLTSFW